MYHAESKSVQLHPSHAVDREISQEFGDRNLKRPADAQQDRQARYLRAAFEVARVRRGDACRFGELFLRPACREAKLAQTLPEDLCFDCHVLSFNDR